MRKIGLILMLGALLLVGAGCGGGRGGSSNDDSNDGTNTTTPTLNPKVPGTYTINLSYKATNGNGDTIKLIVKSIEVNRDKTLKVNCTWTVTNSNSTRIVKAGDWADLNTDVDENTETFYIVQSNTKRKYHKSGDGAAYTTTELSSTPVTGSYTFQALDNGINSFYFTDSVYTKQTGNILVTSSN